MTQRPTDTFHSDIAQPTLLIVEDDDALTSYLSDVMRDEGYRVICANTRAEALKIRPQPLQAVRP